jgi:peptidoglycan/LPS O-acetylase OafA/YrhL
MRILLMAVTIQTSPELTPNRRTDAEPSRHVTSLDGLRALALLAVMAVHSGVPGTPLGWVGVDLFFVLSGFLITSLLADEFARHGRISLTKFWGRRFLRLMPAYWVYVGALTAAITLYQWGWVQKHGGWTAGDYIASLWLYFINYAPQGGIWEHQWLSLHLWSLAVEEQFYFLWPIICVLAFRLGRPQSVAWVLVVMILMRRIWMGDGDGSLDPRGLGIMLGCAVALSLHDGRLPALRRWLGLAPFRISILFAIVAIVATATYFRMHGYSEATAHRSVVPIIVVPFALLIAMLWYGPTDWISRALSWKPLAYVGKISYGMYLYHMFCHYLTWDVITSGIENWPRWPKFGLRLLVYFVTTLGVATLSYQLLEKRFLRLKSYLR